MMGQPDEIVQRFLKMVRAGESPRMAEILACRKAPTLETDTNHYAGMGMAHIEKIDGKPYAQTVWDQAKAAGISVNSNSIYNATMADERCGGDPNAWLLAGDGRDKFKKVVQDKGGFCESLGIESSNGKYEEILDKKDKEIKAKKARREEMAGGPLPN